MRKGGRQRVSSQRISDTFSGLLRSRCFVSMVSHQLVAASSAGDDDLNEAKGHLVR